MSDNPVLVRTRPRYIPALDGVRLLAVLLVILHHITRGSTTSVLLHLVGLQRGNGVGPSLFFVLSGVLLTTVILEARDSEHRYRNFLMRRVLRIFPLYFAYLIAAVVATWVIKGTPPQNLWIYAAFLQNTLAEPAANTGSRLPLYHFWTLAVQDQFYVFWPLVLWNCGSIGKMRRVCYALIALSFLTRFVITLPPLSTELLGRILPSYAGSICLGALISLEARERTLLTPILKNSLLPLSLLCGVWMWHGLNILTPLGSTFGLQLIALVCGSLIVCALDPRSWTSRILGSKYFALGGKNYAFAMYIFHPLVLTICIDHLPIASKGIRLSIFAVVTVVVSGLSYRYYEHPFLKLPLGRTDRKAPENPVTAPAPSSSSFSIPA